MWILVRRLGDNLNILIMCPQIVGLEWLSPSPLALHLPLLDCDLILSSASSTCIYLHSLGFLNWKHKCTYSPLKDNILCLCMWYPHIQIYSAWTVRVFPPFWQRAEGCQGVCYFLHITHFFFLSPLSLLGVSNSAHLSSSPGSWNKIHLPFSGKSKKYSCSLNQTEEWIEVLRKEEKGG